MNFLDKVRSIFLCAGIMFFGLVIFKYIPMYFFGGDILYDASAHVVVTAFALFVLWYFIDQTPKLRIPYFVFSCAVLIIVAVQRFIDLAHDEFGIILGIAVSVAAIVIARWDYFGDKLSF